MREAFENFAGFCRAWRAWVVFAVTIGLGGNAAALGQLSEDNVWQLVNPGPQPLAPASQVALVLFKKTTFDALMSAAPDQFVTGG